MVSIQNEGAFVYKQRFSFDEDKLFKNKNRSFARVVRLKQGNITLVGPYDTQELEEAVNILIDRGLIPQ